MSNKDLIQITKDYYDSKEADAFYSQIWGGEDIHIGIYKTPEQSIREASRNTVLEMVKKIPSLKKNHKVLDLGSGYGGAARYLAEEYGCQVDCINLSEKENERNRKMTEEAGLGDLITITSGNFEKLPFNKASYDIVWSQEALLHSNKKDKVFWEVAWVLKPGGRFIFTDPMKSDDCPEGVLEDVLDRLHLEGLESVSSYQKLADSADLESVFVLEMPEQLITHYSKVLEALKEQQTLIARMASEAYVEKTMTGLQHWVDAGKKGYLNWGILQFQKRNV